MSGLLGNRRHLSAVGIDDSMPDRIRVAIADDHPLMRRGLGRLLEGAEDIEVLTDEAVDLESTARLAAECRPDVLVLDLSMPGGSSLQLAAELRGRLPEMQIVIVSMEDAPAFARRALASGARGYVLKDLADEDLEAAIRAAARGREYLSARVAGRMSPMHQKIL